MCSCSSSSLLVYHSRIFAPSNLSIRCQCLTWYKSLHVVPFSLVSSTFLYSPSLFFHFIFLPKGRLIVKNSRNPNNFCWYHPFFIATLLRRKNIIGCIILNGVPPVYYAWSWESKSPLQSLVQAKSIGVMGMCHQWPFVQDVCRICKILREMGVFGIPSNARVLYGAFPLNTLDDDYFFCFVLFCLLFFFP